MEDKERYGETGQDLVGEIQEKEYNFKRNRLKEQIEKVMTSITGKERRLEKKRAELETLLKQKVEDTGEEQKFRQRGVTTAKDCISTDKGFL